MKILAVLYPGGDAADDDRLLGCAENALGLREAFGDDHEIVVTTDLEGDDLEGALADAEVLITTPFWPLQVTEELFDVAKALELIVTAGVGSDHVDLAVARDRGITVVEVTGSNVVSVAEHAIMQTLVLLRNFVAAHRDVVEGGWNIGEVAAGSHDLEHKTVAIYGAGRIGQLIGLRLRPFDVTTLYYKRSRLSASEEATTGMRYALLDEIQRKADVVIIGAPLTPETRGLFDRDVIAGMKRGASIVNIARGAIVDRDAVVEALESGQLGGYAGDVWDPQPAPADHPWRTMPHHAMTAHISGTTLESQARYASGVADALRAWIAGEDQRKDDVMVQDGEIVGGAYKAAFE